jgi:hypothetical protein
MHHRSIAIVLLPQRFRIAPATMRTHRIIRPYRREIMETR